LPDAFAEVGMSVLVFGMEEQDGALWVVENGLILLPD